ncbi:hypothetical protein CF651_13250 [Paenibacillus rigui]|uniref:Uncharacterized protein n=1 Tax=Paenibacillus rigui TaxID=554312 RepID=A0A229US09_9BACL|nr:hypothetical protein CF651_13250 [Paenibacillus rigui]
MVFTSLSCIADTNVHHNGEKHNCKRLEIILGKTLIVQSLISLRFLANNLIASMMLNNRKGM